MAVNQGVVPVVFFPSSPCGYGRVQSVFGGLDLSVGIAEVTSAVPAVCSCRILFLLHIARAQVSNLGLCPIDQDLKGLCKQLNLPNFFF